MVMIYNQKNIIQQHSTGYIVLNVFVKLLRIIMTLQKCVLHTVILTDKTKIC